MLFKSLAVLATSVTLASPVLSAPLSPVQLPNSSFDGAHTTEAWTPSRVDRLTAPSVRLASQASWYGPGFHGRRTASGQVFNQHALTAAHRSLPFGTRVKVTNLNNGRSVVVAITDDGPHVSGRVIDLSMAAAERIGMISSGTAPVRLEVLR